MISIKTPSEMTLMRQGGKITARVLKEVLAQVSAGQTLKEIDHLADQLIVKYGGQPSFKTEKGYHWATCLCLNDVVVHGIPTEEKIKKGDVLNVDLGVYFGGFHTDAAWTVQIKDNNLKLKFLATGEEALANAISQCRPGNHIGDISRAIQQTVEGAGYSCVKQLVGHGVGKLLHEDPEVPCYVRGDSVNTPEITEGMTLAIEVIYNEGKSPVVYKNKDGWTIVTKDGSLSAVFEHTVVITPKGAEILTL